MADQSAADLREEVRCFAEASVTFTREAAPGMHSAIIRAVRPA
jgi:hypothetical protein